MSYTFDCFSKMFLLLTVSSKAVSDFYSKGGPTGKQNYSPPCRKATFYRLEPHFFVLDKSIYVCTYNVKLSIYICISLKSPYLCKL